MTKFPRFHTLLLLLLLACENGFSEETPPASVKALDLSGHRVDPFQNSQARLLVFVFVRTDCPIANSYAPLIRRLYMKYTARKVAFWLVYVDKDESPEDIRKHMDEHGYECAALRDTKLALAKKSKARVTPEAAVFQPTGELLYHGRLDDRWVDIGKYRPEATQHDLAHALDDAVAGRKIAAASQKAVGCPIEGIK